MRRILLLTTVHHPDDTRIRERMARTLATEFAVELAAREPGPSDPTGLEWIPLRGGRLRRNLCAFVVALRRPYDVLVLNDPETIPLGLVIRWLRRVMVVLDVHEDVPAQLRTKDWIPSPLRSPTASLATRMLHLAERNFRVILAEEGYAGLFEDPHPVIPNHPDTTGWPEPIDRGDGRVTYVGDITRIRGLETLVAAAATAHEPLTLIGPIDAGFRARLVDIASGHGVELDMPGRLPHPRAMDLVRRASVGVAPLHDVPNYRHSVPTKVLEYLALGLPVVASDLPGTRRLVEGLDAVWLVPPGDVDALAVALGQAAAPEAKATAVAQAGAVRARFSWPAEQVLEIYRVLD